ncbi:hypothetical protein [Streptomyces sp. B29(2018)]|uniref:hypothetical protein n=1 Tax=Streptomyces sp. B29(2018) TaxID=2485016 RepID=UPI0013E39A12|nr:hypothetical protein [Streptomyces sp. B29(2018)]
MKQFLITVAGGVAVGIILNKMRQPQQQAGNKASDYAGSSYQAWVAQQEKGA